MDKELFETITELRQDGKKWQEIFDRVSHYFPSTHVMKKNYERYRQRFNQ
jgi:hypothetical protein